MCGRSYSDVGAAVADSGGLDASLAFNSQPLKPPQAFCFAYPAFPIKRKSRKLNPKLPARYPKATRSKPTVYKS